MKSKIKWIESCSLEYSRHVTLIITECSKATLFVLHVGIAQPVHMYRHHALIHLTGRARIAMKGPSQIWGTRRRANYVRHAKPVHMYRHHAQPKVTGCARAALPGPTHRLITRRRANHVSQGQIHRRVQLLVPAAER